jgi:hypothetical protein
MYEEKSGNPDLDTFPRKKFFPLEIFWANQFSTSIFIQDYDISSIQGSKLCTIPILCHFSAKNCRFSQKSMLLSTFCKNKQQFEQKTPFFAKFFKKIV